MSMNLSRRGFMKGAAALAAVSAMSGVLAGCGSVSGGSVGGVGAACKFEDGEKYATLTSTDFDIVSIPGQDVIVLPAFTVVNSLGAPLTITGDEDVSLDDGDYALVIKATFDGKLPASEPVKLPDYATGVVTGTSGTTGTALFNNSDNLTYADIDKSKTAKGVLCFTAPFKNWNTMRMNVTFYKKVKDKAAQKVGSATFTFRQ